VGVDDGRRQHGNRNIKEIIGIITKSIPIPYSVYVLKTDYSVETVLLTSQLQAETCVIDIAHFAGTMAKFNAAPRQGHLTAGTLYGLSVTNVENPESTLNKKHNAIAYHKVRECVAARAMRVHHESGKENCSDVLTKFLPIASHYRCCGSILYR
jgi:hypothetical protein